MGSSLRWGQGMGCCGVPAMPSRRQRASWGAQEVPQLEMGFSWCRWRWGGMQGIPGEMNQRVNPQPGAQRQLPVRLFPFASTKGKLQELSCCPSPSRESCPWKNGAEGSHGCCPRGTSWCPPNCGCASAQLTPVPGLQELGRRGAPSPASLHPSLCPGWKRDQLVRRMQDELWLPAA